MNIIAKLLYTYILKVYFKELSHISIHKCMRKLNSINIKIICDNILINNIYNNVQSQASNYEINIINNIVVCIYL